MIVSFLISRLMRPFLKLLAVGMLVLATTQAQAEYMGGGTIIAPRNCSWPTQPEMTRARYIPSENGQPSYVTLNFAVGGVNTYMIRSDLSRTRTWRRGVGQSIWGAPYRMNRDPRVRVLRRETAFFNGDADLAHSRDIRLRLRIRNFGGQPGCVVTVALMLQRWD